MENYFVKMTNTISIFGNFHARKRKFAIISETVRDRVKQSKFVILVGLQNVKLQSLKFSIFKSHDLVNLNFPDREKQSQSFIS